MQTEGVAQARADEMNRRIAGAWMGAALHRQKRLPRLTSLIRGRAHMRKLPTPAELEKRCRAVFGALQKGLKG